MATVTSSKGITHFPAIANPQTASGDPIPGSPPSAIGGQSPISPAAAGCIGTLTINGYSLSPGGLNGAGCDLTTIGEMEIINLINANTAVKATITPQGRLQLTTLAGQAITIAGDATVLAALGLVAGVTN